MSLGLKEGKGKGGRDTSVMSTRDRFQLSAGSAGSAGSPRDRHQLSKRQMSLDYTTYQIRLD